MFSIFFFPERDKKSNPSSIRGDTDKALIKTRPSVSSHPLSDRDLEWVKRRLGTCLSTHASCPRGRKTLPKRVLSFRRPSPSDEIAVHILEGSQREVDYATLSHRWGSHQDCLTTRALLDKYKKGIPWSDLPRTFRESIEFCLAIGINYLWIDALCIVQDDVKDWHSEAAKMADVYQNSYITLAATSARSGASGCFHNSSNSRYQHSLYEESQALALIDNLTDYIDENSKISKVISVREKLSHWQNSVGVSDAHLPSLLTRGWVFQERILSPRILHFCEKEMAWECKSETLCECGGIPPGIMNPRVLFTQLTQSNVTLGSHPCPLPPIDMFLEEPGIHNRFNNYHICGRGVQKKRRTLYNTRHHPYKNCQEMAQDTRKRLQPASAKISPARDDTLTWLIPISPSRASSPCLIRGGKPS